MTLALRALPLVVLLAAGAAAAQERVAPPAPGGFPPYPPQPRTIRVGAEGRASAAPDVALVTVGVEAIGESLARTRSDAEARMRQILAAVKAVGVDAKDVQTVRFDVQIERPWRDGQPGPITGYRVSNLARVRLRDLARVGELLDKVGAAGSNAIQGLAFEKERTSAEEVRALEDAVRKARAKAETLARAAGAALGELQSITESVQAPGPIPMRMEARLARGGGTPVESGEMEVRAMVELVFSIR